ncbi:hypothetical protein HML84_13025 [Alcanivorax sp. IO_7]|nr:hypothetical protein HML84_13025 [Alcanivorax sp. IO_7]
MFIAESLGVSDLIIGLTVVAVGTSCRSWPRRWRRCARTSTIWRWAMC